MFKVKITAGIRFKIGQDVYTVLKRLPNRKVHVEQHGFQSPAIFTQSELIKLLEEGNLEFEAIGKNTRQPKEGSIATSYSVNDLESSPYKEEVIFRFQVIKPLLTQRKRTKDDVRKRVAEINQLIQNPRLAEETLGTTYLKQVSLASLYRWLSDYEKSNGEMRSLVPGFSGCGGLGKSRLHPKVDEFINGSINKAYMDEQRLTIEDIFYDVVAKISDYNEFGYDKIKHPSYPTIARIVAKIPEFELVSKRFSRRDAEIGYAQQGKGVTVSYPLERVEIDATELDVIIIFPDGTTITRPYFVAALDKLTRDILGFSVGFGSAGWPGVMQCLRHVMSDKSYVKKKYPFIINEWSAFGVPGSLVIDNGLEFKNNSMKDACFQLGVGLEFAPPRTPEWKGSIERFLGTTETDFVHKMPGTTRSNTQQLAEGENPKKNACLPFHVFLALLHKWVIDVYTQSLNKGAGGIPAKLWEKWTEEYPVDWPNSSHELPILLGRLKFRVITSRGIELNNMYYNSLELNQILKKFSKDNKGAERKFKVKYDPQNLGEVFVHDDLINQKWIKVPNTDPDYANGLSEWEHLEAKTYATREYGTIDVVSLAKAKAFLREQASAWTSKYNHAKAAKMHSDQEIFGDSEKVLNTQVAKVDYRLPESPDLAEVTDSNFSDIGTSFETDSIPIIPTPLAVISSNGEIKQVQRKGKRKGSKNSTIATQKPIDEFNDDDDLTLDDLIGFGAVTHKEGDFK